MPDPQMNHRDEAAKALRFMIVKAAIVIGIPVVAAMIAVIVML